MPRLGNIASVKDRNRHRNHEKMHYCVILLTPEDVKAADEFLKSSSSDLARRTIGDDEVLFGVPDGEGHKPRPVLGILVPVNGKKDSHENVGELLDLLNRRANQLGNTHGTSSVAS